MPVDTPRRVLLLAGAILLLYPPTREIASGISGWFSPVLGAVLVAPVLAPRIFGGPSDKREAVQ